MAEADVTALLERLLDHNAWATRVLLERCRGLDAEQFTRTFEIGPGSLHDTLAHTIGAMRRWADRLEGRDERATPPTAAVEHTPEELLARLEEADAALRAAARRVVESGRENEPMELRVAGYDDPFVFTRGTAIVHIITHGVHHRAQVLNMLRRLGMHDLPDLDAIECEIEQRGA